MIWLLLLAAIPIDGTGRPLPLYLNPTRAAQAVNEALPALAKCAVDVEGPVTVPVVLNVKSDGVSEQVRLFPTESGASRLVECWTTELQRAPFPTHHETPIPIRFTIYLRDGAVTVSPQVVVVERVIGPVLLFLSPLTSEADKARAAAMLPSGMKPAPSAETEK